MKSLAVNHFWMEDLAAVYELKSSFLLSRQNASSTVLNPDCAF